MPAFQPTAAQFRAFRDDPHSGPVAQVNLLKFRVRAQYRPDDPEYGEDISGRDAYQRYSEAFTVAAAEVGGVTLLLGDTERYFIGGGDWDGVLVNHFPTRQAFIATLNHADYKNMARHREAGLLCQELIVTRPTWTNGVKA
ncbi:MAG: DUF1330 domain-containing protein [Hyphomonas sp.]|uniref:DUF1330 domain-containing protein n=1 Tax=Hyphomonas sp. TaxID=87 RepID=UPI001850CA71|nr:DUF1330 domain-containing protein [Hyphomonas sp.]MBU3919181.1 DUF1330 domain-containing protein [Alphaproteobacteria bacterium]MBA3067497.1 DUF1330 domain-containing protein [Hyphomonas sp.]MBU4063385.1 DUF1330 domain-containing protein [Alphaproteobacteria bacterium]MBU4165205.1 DUF1330 domain-containing protein [Alphaproteobacteria bacterium]MBU4569441.1 DUF1330 domain-containing protein [Alphaproteobacteria bacterium]